MRIHLALEDDALYPRLSCHSDSKLRGLAVSYQTGAVSGKVLTDPAGFQAATTGLFAALRDRIHWENAAVYTLIDSVGW